MIVWVDFIDYFVEELLLFRDWLIGRVFFPKKQKTQKIADEKGSNRSHSILRSPLEETSLPIPTHKTDP